MTPLKGNHARMIYNGNRLKNQLILYCHQGQWDKHENIILDILNDHRNGKNDFFEYMNKNIKKLDPHSIFCLEYVFTRLQEEAVDISMNYINRLLELNDKYPEERERVRYHRHKTIVKQNI